MVGKAMEAEDERTVPCLQIVQSDAAAVGNSRGHRHVIGVPYVWPMR
jgi:hypothetical protein